MFYGKNAFAKKIFFIGNCKRAIRKITDTFQPMIVFALAYRLDLIFFFLFVCSFSLEIMITKGFLNQFDYMQHVSGVYL